MLLVGVLVLVVIVFAVAWCNDRPQYKPDRQEQIDYETDNVIRQMNSAAGQDWRNITRG